MTGPSPPARAMKFPAASSRVASPAPTAPAVELVDGGPPLGRVDDPRHAAARIGAMRRHPLDQRLDGGGSILGTRGFQHTAPSAGGATLDGSAGL